MHSRELEVRMNKILFKGNDQEYNGDVTPVGKNKVAIEFAGGIPKGIDTSFIQVFTPSGVKFLELSGYATEYRRVDACLILSNDGSVFVGEIQPEIDKEKALEDAKVAKKNEVSGICNSTIKAGCDVVISGSPEHFRLTTDDQLNLFGKQIQLMSGAEKCEYHEDGNPCRYYSADEMQEIIKTTMAFKTYHTTYCNALNMWINSAESLEEVASITYGCAVPEAYQNEVLKDLISQVNA